MQKIVDNIVIKKLSCLVLMLCFFTINVTAQSYIDCSTIIEVSDKEIENVKIIDGKTYVIMSHRSDSYLPVINDALPIKSQLAYTSTSLAVFDSDYNQILGTHIDNSNYLSDIELDINANIVVAGYTGTPDFSNITGISYDGSDDSFFPKIWTKWKPELWTLISAVDDLDLVDEA